MFVCILVARSERATRRHLGCLRVGGRSDDERTGGPAQRRQNRKRELNTMVLKRTERWSLLSGSQTMKSNHWYAFMSLSCHQTFRCSYTMQQTRLYSQPRSLLSVCGTCRPSSPLVCDLSPLIMAASNPKVYFDITSPWASPMRSPVVLRRLGSDLTSSACSLWSVAQSVTRRPVASPWSCALTSSQYVHRHAALAVAMAW
jgi:hypothetical protein